MKSKQTLKIPNTIFNIVNCPKFLLLCLLAVTSAAHAFDIETALENYEMGDYKKAYEQFTYLAHGDNTEAQYNLAFMYFGGEGVEQDDKKAAFWFEQAAKLGHSAAQDTLAYMYLNGRGLNKNRIQAYAWYALAAENGVFLAKNVAKNLINQMDDGERENAKRLRNEYIQKYK